MGSYMMGFTQMLSNTDSAEHYQHLIDIHELIYQMIMELVPKLIKDEIEKIETDILVKIQTTLNGKQVDFPDVRKYIEEQIQKELRIALNGLRI